MIDRERRAWIRLLIVVAAAAIGETLGIVMRLPSADVLLPLLFGVAAFFLTAGLARPRVRGEVRYWRGRRIDDN
ncbi:MAG TPA: hypothetical protein VHG53_04065 [Candidatus Limnocylindria bacterium]|nr:hypothetical protein [Candidatus Limnocylindria bacterium]